MVGDPNAKVSRIQLGVGYATPAVNDAGVDVVISGEQQEVDGGFDSPEYVLDAVALGIPKGWIMLGHAVSEEAGMLEMAQWIGASSPKCRCSSSRPGPFLRGKIEEGGDAGRGGLGILPLRMLLAAVGRAAGPKVTITMQRGPRLSRPASLRTDDRGDQPRL